MDSAFLAAHASMTRFIAIYTLFVGGTESFAHNCATGESFRPPLRHSHSAPDGTH
jgi:hypothetical protein